MILQTIIDIAMTIITTILDIIMSIFPGINIAVQMGEMLAKIITICYQANNFIHFILGDFVVVIMPLVIGLLVFKYIAYPIIVFIRSIFVNGNN